LENKNKPERSEPEVLMKGVPKELGNNLNRTRGDRASQQDLSTAQPQREGEQGEEKIKARQEGPTFPGATQAARQTGAENKER